MENATKALLIAAGIFFGLLILTLCIYMFSQISNYYNQTNEEKLKAEIVKFNSEYEKYASNDVRGTDLLSLINKVVDYNKREATDSTQNYQRIEILVDIKGKEEQFKYTGITSGIDYNNLIQNLNNKLNDNNLYLISNAVKSIAGGYKESQLRRLTTNISNIFAPYSYTDKLSNSYKSAEQKRNSLIKDIIGTNYNDLSADEKKQLEKATLEYYQYEQFKKAHFKCVSTKYNNDTGRIVYLGFEFTGKFE